MICYINENDRDRWQYFSPKHCIDLDCENLVQKQFSSFLKKWTEVKYEKFDGSTCYLCNSHKLSKWPSEKKGNMASVSHQRMHDIEEERKKRIKDIKLKS